VAKLRQQELDFSVVGRFRDHGFKGVLRLVVPIELHERSRTDQSQGSRVDAEALRFGSLRECQVGLFRIAERRGKLGARRSMTGREGSSALEGGARLSQTSNAVERTSEQRPGFTVAFVGADQLAGVVLRFHVPVRAIREPREAEQGGPEARIERQRAPEFGGALLEFVARAEQLREIGPELGIARSEIDAAAQVGFRLIELSEVAERDAKDLHGVRVRCIASEQRAAGGLGFTQRTGLQQAEGAGKVRVHAQRA
jgi:hypothetical protein